MVWNNLIERDRITSVSAGFYDKMILKLRNRMQHRETDRFFRKKHIWMSIAAGILMGIILFNLQDHFSAAGQRNSKMEAWVSRYYLDDLVIEKMDIHLF